MPNALFWPFENPAQNVHVFVFPVTSNKPVLKIKPHLRTECFTTCSLYSSHALCLLVIVAAINVADHGVQRAHSLKMSCWTQKSVLLFLKLIHKRCYQVTGRERKDSPKCSTCVLQTGQHGERTYYNLVQRNSFFCFSWHHVPQSLSRVKKLLHLYREYVNIFVCRLSTVNNLLDQNRNLSDTIICPWDSHRTYIWKRKTPEKIKTGIEENLLP